MLVLVVLGLLTLAGLVGWITGPDTRDPDFTLSWSRRDIGDRQG